MAKGITNCESGTGDKGLYVWATYDVAPYRASATPGDASSENIILAEGVTSDSIAIYIASTYQFNGDTGTYTLHNPTKVIINKNNSEIISSGIFNYVAYASADSSVIYGLDIEGATWTVSYGDDGLVELICNNSNYSTYTKYDAIHLPSKGQQFNGFITSNTSLATQDGQHSNEWWIGCHDIVSANNCTQGAIDVITFTSYEESNTPLSYSLPTLPNRVMLFDPAPPVLQSINETGLVVQAFMDFTTSRTSNQNATILGSEYASSNEFIYTTIGGSRSVKTVGFDASYWYFRPGVEYILITMA